MSKTYVCAVAALGLAGPCGVDPGADEVLASDDPVVEAPSGEVPAAHARLIIGDAVPATGALALADNGLGAEARFHHLGEQLIATGSPGLSIMDYAVTNPGAEPVRATVALTRPAT